MPATFVTLDGNEAATSIAYQTSEVISIYPITPASPMGELADAWASEGRENIFGTAPSVVEMQSEAGAAGSVHGSLQTGALTTTFTASQGLLLMMPNMFKIAGELTPTVFHIAARTVATHALSIFGDHSDVMAARSTGWAMLCSGSVQEAHDLALVAHAATLRARIPFLHFFDGFRTSHEVAKIELIPRETIDAMIDRDLVRAHRARALDPDWPVLRGTAQNPDVFFQAREASNPFTLATAGIVQGEMDKLAALTGRQYRLFDYVGHPRAERVMVMMGSGVGAAEEAVEALVREGEAVGLVKVRLYRPFAAAAFVGALPRTVTRVAVLDRTKEPGATGEPLYQDVVAALVQEWAREYLPLVTRGRYGLSSKEFTPAMAAAVLGELCKPEPQREFTVGITDDVTRLSLAWDRGFSTDSPDEVRAVFYGLGSDGTVGANKNSVKIIGEGTGLYAQGYFVYDSRKAGAVTVSHLRFGPRPIRSTYLIERAGFVACHQFHFLERIDVLEVAEPGATFLLNSPYGAGEVWEHLPREVQEQILEKRLRVYVIDAARVARESGLGSRINTVMQPCFFALAGVLPREEAIARIKGLIEKTYSKRGEEAVRRNLEAVDRSLAELHEVRVPGEVRGSVRRQAIIPPGAPDFVERVTSVIIAGKGDLLPVSAMPVDGTFPTGTSVYEKRSIAAEIPIWDPSLCTDCGLCSLVCPHAAIRGKVYRENGRTDGLPSKRWKGKDFPEALFTVQVAPEDCTGCGLCVEICPSRSKESVKRKALNMEPKLEHLARECERYERFKGIPQVARGDVKLETVKGAQLLRPYFEFSGACAGCAETPYVKLMSQLFGDRLLVANATGCSSIYGGNLPTTPWTVDDEGRGPAWNNSLFEDNAEFGLGMRLALNQRHEYAARLLRELAPRVGEELAGAILGADQSTEAGIAEQRARVRELVERLAGLDLPAARELESEASALVRRSVWVVGGDGWAYDIGFGGLDHVLATGRDVNLLVLDTEVYSNTGGQASKATPRAAVAKFAAGGKPLGKKDLGLLAMAYGNVYVAQIALGANPTHAIRSFLEAESYRGPSLIIAYCPCIAHGIDMAASLRHQKAAVECGYWPLYHFDPRRAHLGDHPLKIDSRRGDLTFREFAATETRFAAAGHLDGSGGGHLMELAQRDIDERWRFYEQMAGMERAVPEQEVAT